MEELYLTLIDIEDHCSDLVERKNEAEHKIGNIERDIRELEKQIEHKKEQLDERKAEYDSIMKAFSSSKAQLDGLELQFEEAKSVKTRVDDYWKNLGEPIADNASVMNYEPKKFDGIIDAQLQLEDKRQEDEPTIIEEKKEEVITLIDKDSKMQIGVAPNVDVAESIQNGNKTGTIFIRDIPPEQKSIDGNKKMGFLGNIFKKDK
jgi:chromosome segregation ATPase